jgi:hypothetical protein
MSGGVLGAVAARAEAWLLEPAPARAARAERELPPAAVVAVVGLGRACGATTIARALAVELARRDGGGVAVVQADSAPPAALATGPARRLARRLGADARACGRLALICEGTRTRELARAREVPLVIDVGHGTPPEPALALADRALLVASPAVEPALAGVAAEALGRGGLPPLVVLNRAVDAEGWGELPDIRVAESRLGARLALAGRDPLGALGTAAAALADACGELAVDA